jgi:GDPmannose 4,6-dehydratase
MKLALITGITGQDGAYLSKLLLKKNYRIIGLTRPLLQPNLSRLHYLGIENNIEIETCDLLDLNQVIQIIDKYQPTEIYNLSAQSSVFLSFREPISTIQNNFTTVINLLEAIRIVNNKIKFFQPTSGEMYGNANVLPITEKSFFQPLSPYAISKVSAHWFCINYRESYGLFISCGILFNHESYLRGEEFFIKKVIRSAIAIKKNRQEFLIVGNIDVERDFGYAPKYVEAMYLMMQSNKPDDFLICSGESVSLRKIIEYVFERLAIEKDKIIIDKSLYRPTDVQVIYGSNEKIKTILGWDYSFHFFQILDILIKEELENQIS